MQKTDKMSPSTNTSSPALDIVSNLHTDTRPIKVRNEIPSKRPHVAAIKI